MGNTAYSLWRVNGCQQGLRSVASFGFGGQESASKPPQAICKTLANIEKTKNGDSNYSELVNEIFIERLF